MTIRFLSTGGRAAMRKRLSVSLVAVLVIGGCCSPPLFGQERPAYLPASLTEPFETYTNESSQRAFALGRNGAWGTAYGRSSLQAAREAALANCRAYADQCVVIAENDEIVRPEPPFPAPSTQNAVRASPEGFSDRTVFFMTLAALGILGVGTFVSEKYPLYLFETFLSDVFSLRMNYALILFGFFYFLLMMPLFGRLAERNFSNLLNWIVFALPILLYGLSVLYLYRKGKLSDRFELK